MSYEKHPGKSPEQQYSEGKLHHAETSIDGVLIPRDQAFEQYGIDADILDVITLPGDEEMPEGKQLAILDFGDVGPDGKVVTHVYDEEIKARRPIPMLGVARTRFGVKALNYTPRSHMASYTALHEGETRVGRHEPDEINYLVGLGDDEPGNSFISRSHLSITLENGAIRVSDHSTNGTVVESLKQGTEQHVQQHEHEEVPEAVARDVGDVAIRPNITDANQNGIIDFVPMNREEAVQLQNVERQRIDQARDAAIDAKFSKIDADIDEITKDLSEADKLALSDRSRNLMLKKDAQNEGNGRMSIVYEQEASKAHKQLSPEAERIASQYHHLHTQRNQAYI